MELAALASAAVPGLSPAGVAGAPDDAADFTSAVVIDDAGKQWRVRSPKHAEASMRLETELLVLRSFTPGIRAELSFQVPSVAGTVQRGDLRSFVYNHVPGKTMELEALVAEGGSVPTEIGRAMAGIHDLPQEMVDKADLPSYTADEFRTRRLNELDQAATTGKIPPALLRRWEHALEDVTLWKFNPCVVHGDLHEDNLQISDGLVTSVTGWTDLRIGDPADDFAWLVAVHEQSFADVVLESYNKYRQEPVDPHLMRRAALAAEFALAQWLVRGLAAEDAEMVAEAEEMLRELEADIREYGGQPISVELPPVPVSPPAMPDRAPAPKASAETDGMQAKGPSVRDGAVQNSGPEAGGGEAVVLIHDAGGDNPHAPVVVGGAAAGSGTQASVVVVEGSGAGSESPASRSGATEDDADGDNAAPQRGSEGGIITVVSSGAAGVGHAPDVPDGASAGEPGPPAVKGPEATTTAIPIVEPGSRS